MLRCFCLCVDGAALSFRGSCDCCPRGCLLCRRVRVRGVARLLREFESFFRRGELVSQALYHVGVLVFQLCEMDKGSRRFVVVVVVVVVVGDCVGGIVLGVGVALAAAVFVVIIGAVVCR